MKFKWSKGKIFLLLILGAFAIHLLFFRAPSEAQMIDKFHAHKAQFEQIRLMLAHDRNIHVIGPDWVTAQWGFTPEGVSVAELPFNVSNARLAHYRALLKQLGMETLVVDARRHRVRLYQFGGGFTDTSWSIGYAWSRDTPKPLVKSAYNQYPGKDKIHYSRVEGDWYIYNSH